MFSQDEVLDSLPPHLRPFAARQDYSLYTPRDQAVWRFLLHQLREHLASTAQATYLEGLQRTGITLDAIPRIEEMNRCLNDIGWRAVVVDGFIPPAIFMEFQAQKVLVIAVDIRSFEHMLYTPAPDIVHESAGHAPFIIDVDYAEFLQRFGELGMHAIASKSDMSVYEAIRCLSIVKEAPNATAEEIAAAEQSLQTAIEANDTPSEAALLARLHWWTVEYGLVGSVDDYRLYGAGLLSSLGECVNCLDDERVIKRPLTLDAINTSYDITNEQPHLFVTRNCRHLTQVLEEFGRQMCVNRGGAESVQKAIDAETVNTAVTNAGVEISGQFTRLLTDAMGNITYICTTGPTQLAYRGKQLPGQGVEAHSAGFGSPVGRLQAMERCLGSYTIDELKQHGITEASHVSLAFLSGVTVSGQLTKILRREQKNLIFTFEQCTVTSGDGECLFQPEWGLFDMAVGADIDSVYGGAADPQTYSLYAAPTLQATVHVDYDEATQTLFDYYAHLRQLREGAEASPATARQSLLDLIRDLEASGTDEWLIYFELLELGKTVALDESVCRRLEVRLQQLADTDDTDRSTLIGYGLERLPTSDSTAAVS